MALLVEAAPRSGKSSWTSFAARTLARRSIVESLVRPDAVVDVAEAAGLHR